VMPDEKWTGFTGNESNMLRKGFSAMDNNCAAIKMRIWLGIVFTNDLVLQSDLKLVWMR